MTTTLRQEINSSPDGEGDWLISISAESEWGNYRMEEWHDIEPAVLPYSGPMSGCPDVVLDHEYDTGYGSPSRPMWNAWTDNYVVVCTEYDGSTNCSWWHRNPPTNQHPTTNTQGE